MGYAPRTLRRMPENTRKIARLVNDVESAGRRLGNQIDAIREMEADAKALAQLLTGPDSDSASLRMTGVQCPDGTDVTYLGTYHSLTWGVCDDDRHVTFTGRDKGVRQWFGETHVEDTSRREGGSHDDLA